MPSKQTIDAKMIQKRSTVPGEVPSIGPSNDHTDGTWEKNDIYSGEFFLNIPDELLYLGVGNSVYEVGTNRGIEKDDFVLASNQDVFVTTKNILSKFAVFEDGILTTRDVSKTGPKEITTNPAIPAGTKVEIIY